MSDQETADIVEVLLQAIAVFEALGIEYAIAGSIASSAFGEPRGTNDADLVIRVMPEQADRLVEALSVEFYVPEQTLRLAVARGTAFNIVHLEKSRKVDLFVGLRPVDLNQLRRNTGVASRLARRPRCASHGSVSGTLQGEPRRLS